MMICDWLISGEDDDDDEGDAGAVDSAAVSCDEILLTPCRQNETESLDSEDSDSDLSSVDRGDVVASTPRRSTRVAHITCASPDLMWVLIIMALFRSIVVAAANDDDDDVVAVAVAVAVAAATGIVVDATSTPRRSTLFAHHGRISRFRVQQTCRTRWLRVSFSFSFSGLTKKPKVANIRPYHMFSVFKTVDHYTFNNAYST
jgi:hypothetical protein